MNNTLYFNGTNYLCTSNLNDGICISINLSCSKLFTARRIISYTATVGNFFIIPFTLYLTFAKVTDGFFKYFTLNLMVNCILSAIAQFVNDVIGVKKLFFPMSEHKLCLIRILCWARFCINLGAIWFHALTLYAVIVCYLPYVKPLFYSKYFVKKSQKLYYVVLHISIILWGAFVTLLHKEFIIRIPYFLTHMALFIALFIAALIGSIIISRYKSLGSNSEQIAKMQQKRLYSFILYSYSIEIITLPMFINMTAYFICAIAGCERSYRESKYKSILNFIIYYFYETRTINIFSITILALEPYRRATFSLFYREKWTTNVVPMQLRK